MKNLFFKSTLITLYLAFGTMTLAPASAAVRHPFQEKRQEARLKEQARNLPLFDLTTPPTRPFKDLREIAAHGILTKNRERIYLKLRVEAFKLKADAVSDVRCKAVKSMAISCYGTAIRWLDAPQT